MDPARVPFDTRLTEEVKAFLQERLLRYPEVNSFSVANDYVPPLDRTVGLREAVWVSMDGENPKTLGVVFGAALATLRLLSYQIEHCAIRLGQMKALKDQYEQQSQAPKAAGAPVEGQEAAGPTRSG